MLPYAPRRTQEERKSTWGRNEECMRTAKRQFSFLLFLSAFSACDLTASLLNVRRTVKARDTLWTSRATGLVAAWITGENHEENRLGYLMSRQILEKLPSVITVCIVTAMLTYFYLLFINLAGVGKDSTVIAATYCLIFPDLKNRLRFLWGNQCNEWLAGGTNVLGENLPQWSFVHPNNTWLDHGSGTILHLGGPRLAFWVAAQPAILVWSEGAM